MDKKEILDLLQRMSAYRTEDGVPVIEPMRLIEDPIVTNRMCVDALQQLPANSKITMIVAADENGQYLGYSAATTAWARFGVFSAYNGCLNKSAQLKKNDKVIICLDTLESESQIQQIKKCVEDKGAKVAAVFCMANIGNVSAGKLQIISLVDVETARVIR